ncbi:DNA-3-methyladenine glycosylase [Synoicihabitans lomoniglobus]|uniref:Putative 3-methyladenine DNA glycosylase n=1 Tax=Synoicihabitans lomoniglobus TaxID=2909285 RepID=A0AAF0I5F8_9BACT|nr:DNA-3-methyladenine glycosylase [Opitutaceae bacterium LMO-M01]WED67020.1 DNA-3-methyladenine glycosylase [Opitutaceae bacterium LMO-M01]
MGNCAGIGNPGIANGASPPNNDGMARIVAASEWSTVQTVQHARSLLGKLLVRQSPTDGTRIRTRITETEAYDGPRDQASHAFRGRTPRTSVMFEPAGVWYVYLCYGVHEMLNLVTGPRDYPAAVLIRGTQRIQGPGRLTKRLGIDRDLNTQPCAPASGLWLEDDGRVVPADEVSATPRIGIDYAGPNWAAKPWRFVWRGSDES